MGVNPTPSNYKTFTFDNTNSAQYGVYITGKAVFNAPQRNVEMVTIPGRNGAYALDHGNFNNIEVTYPAGIVADTEADFAQAVSDLRNFLCSKEGYCRLTDDYNSGEYRMAIYKSGLEVDHEGLLTGEFDLVFECKPQRWLTSGETKTTLTSGNAITNPTLFDARPQLQVYGYGSIDIGGEVVTVQNIPVGEVVLYGGGQLNAVVLDESNLNVGDTIIVNARMLSPFIETVLTQSMAYHGVENVSITCSGSGYTATFGSHGTKTSTDHLFYIDIIPTSFTLVSGTNSTITNNVSGSFQVKGYPNGFTLTFSFTQTYTYTASTHTLTYNISNTSVSSSAAWCTPTLRRGIASYNSIIGDSTKSANGNPTYIDLDIGEAYNIVGGSAVSVNNAVSIPAELPTLPSGATTITFDNTFTKVDIVPRWWRV